MGVFSRAGAALARAVRADSAQPQQTRLDGWVSALTGFGVQGVDKRLGAHYDLQVVDSQTAQYLWRSNDVAARIVEKVPSEALRAGFELTLDDKDDAGRVLKRYVELEAARHFFDAMCKERAFGGSAIFPVLRDDQASLALPLNENSVVGLSHLQVFEARELKPSSWYTDPLSPNFGEPETYWLFPRTRGGLASANGIEIHESRLIVFPGIRVSRDQVSHEEWGDSVLQRPHDVLRDFGVSWSAVGVMLTDFAQTVYSIKGLAEMIAQDKDNEFQNRLRAVDLARSVLRMVLIDSEETLERKQTPVAGLADLLDRFESRLAAAADMPITVVMGRAPAGLNATGESDIRLFYDRVSVFQELTLRSRLEKLIRLIMRDLSGPLGGREPQNWSLAFRPLWQPSEKERADTRYVVSQTDALYHQMGAVSADEIARSRWGGEKYSSEMAIDFAERDRLEAEFEAERAKLLMEGVDQGGEVPRTSEESASPDASESGTSDEDAEEALNEIDEVEVTENEEGEPEFVVVKVREHQRKIRPKRRQDSSSVQWRVRYDEEENYRGTQVLWARVPADVVAAVNDQLPVDTKIRPPAHVTVVFLGRVEDERATLDSLRSALAEVPPMTASITGMGAFSPKPGSTMAPLVALVNLRGGTEVRARALAAVRDSGVKIDRTFGFIPHMAISMVDDIATRDMQELRSREWQVSELEVVQGDRIVDVIPLLGTREDV